MAQSSCNDETDLQSNLTGSNLQEGAKQVS